MYIFVFGLHSSGKTLICFDDDFQKSLYNSSPPLPSKIVNDPVLILVLLLVLELVLVLWLIFVVGWW